MNDDIEFLQIDDDTLMMLDNISNNITVSTSQIDSHNIENINEEKSPLLVTSY